MNIILFLFLNFTFSLNGFNCSNTAKNDPLPDSRPDKLVIEYHIDGGMRYYSEALYISEDSSYYTVNDGGAISRVIFEMSSQELDELYKVFTDNSFSRIQTYEEKVYDRGGSSIYIRWAGGRFTSVSNSGMTFVSQGWLDEWKACISALQKITGIQAGRQKRDYEIRLDNSMFGKEISVYINSNQVISKSVLAAEKDSEEFISKSTKLMPGKHRLSVSWDKKYDNINIDADSSKGIILMAVNGSLKHKFIQ